MSKVTCTYDTVTKEFAVEVDGKSMDSVTNFQCCEYGLEITSFEEDEDSEMRHYTRTVASDSKDAKLASDKYELTKAEIEGYIKYPFTSKVSGDILNFLSK